MRIVYNGLPLHLSEDGVRYSWRMLPRLLHLKPMAVDGWVFSRHYMNVYLRERMDWGYYLPPGGVQGKRVLSVGAGCGEDAKFFFDNGALLVYAVEPNPECVPYLLTNAANHIGLKPIFKMFKPEMLNLGFDLLKVDIEGYEVELLPYLGDVEQDIVIESHCNYTHDKLIALGFQPSKPLAADQAIGNGVAIFHRWRK